MPNKPITKKEKKAWEFARNAHRGQVRRFINQPYFDAHVKEVNAIVKQYTTNEDILCASILHDVVEDFYDDIATGLKEISEIFGETIAGLVKELTSLKDDIESGEAVVLEESDLVDYSSMPKM